MLNEREAVRREQAAADTAAADREHDCTFWGRCNTDVHGWRRLALAIIVGNDAFLKSVGTEPTVIVDNVKKYLNTMNVDVETYLSGQH